MEDLNPSEISKIIKDRINKLDVSAEESNEGTIVFLADGIARAAQMGYRRVVVIPYFLFTGILIKRIYSAVDEVQPKFPDVEVLKAGYLGVHPHVTDVWVEKAREALVGINSSNCSLCKYRTQIVGYEGEVGKVQEAHHHHVRGILGDSHTHHHGAEAAHSYPHTHHQHQKGLLNYFMVIHILEFQQL